MDNYKPTKVLVASLAACGFLFTACSGSSAGKSSSINPINPANSAITIDNTGTIPVFSGSSTRSVVYVHNNSNQTISNIKFTAKTNYSGANNTSNINLLFNKVKILLGIKSSIDSDGFSIDASKCNSIQAGQSCPIGFTSPIINPTTAQASAIITANFSIGSQSYHNSNLLNFVHVNNSVTNGAVIQSGVSLSGFGNSEAYGTVYIYGSGVDQLYNITSLASNNPGIKIIQGNITGQQIQSNFVQAVEVSAPNGSRLTAKAKSENKILETNSNGDTGLNATLTVHSTDLQNSHNFNSIASLAVTPLSNGAILTSGLVPLINVAVANPIGMLFIVNAGNESASLGSIIYPLGVEAMSGGSGACGSSIAPGFSCTIYFTFSNQSGGSGIIEVPYAYAGGTNSLLQNVTWYNGIGAPLLTLAAQNNPLNFSQTIGANNTVTVTNVGGYKLNNMIAANPQVMSGSATASLTTPTLSCHDVSNNATGTTLPIGGTCTYTVNVNDTISEAGSIKINISGDYNNGTEQTYSRQALFGYSSIAYVANLSLSPNPAIITTIGDNVESSTQIVNLINMGAAPAIISSLGLTDNPNFLTANNNCGSTLNPNESCNVTLKLGPTAASSIESGTASLSVNYSGGANIGSITTSSVNWTVQPNSQNLTLGAISATGSTGTGTSADPYVFNGAVTSGQNITFTYTNGGSNPVKITGVNNSYSPISWNLNLNSSTCYNNGNLPSETIAAGGSCTIVFDNVLGTNANALPSIGSSYTENITVPSLVFADQNTGMQFQVQPTISSGGTTIYAIGTQATLANSITVDGNNLIVKNVLANAIGYSSVSVTSRMESYFTSMSPSSGCTSSSSTLTNEVTQVCSLYPILGTATGSVTYTMDTSNYLNNILTTLFSIDTNGQTISMSPLFATAVISDNVMNHYIYIINHGDDSYTQCSVSPTTGALSGCNTVIPQSPGALSSPSGIAISNGYAYIVNQNDNSYTQCSVSPTTGALSGCNNVIPQSPGELSLPSGIAISNGYAYIINQGDNSYTQCSVSSTTGALSGCNTVILPNESSNVYPTTITISNGYAYIMNLQFNQFGTFYSYTQCLVSSTTGVLSGCNIVELGAPNVPSYGATISNGYAYITEVSNNGYAQCSVSPTTGALSGCNTVIPQSPGELSLPFAITISNGYAYITNISNNSYTQCSVSPTTGALSGCNTVIPQSPGALSSPFAITVY